MNPATEVQQPLFVGIIWIVVLLLANAFFVAVEFALVSLRRSRIQDMVQQGNATAKVLHDMQEDMDTTIAGAQLGITLASLALGWVADSTLHRLVEMFLNVLPLGKGVHVPSGIGVVLSFVMLSMIHVILGEQVPKSCALRFPEKVAMILAWPFRAFCVALKPLIWLMNFLAIQFLRLFRVPVASESAHAIGSSDEYSILFKESTEAGVLHEHEQELLNRTLVLREKVADSLMIPRTRVRWIDLNESKEEILEQLLQTSHSRLAVARGDLDEMLGFVRTKDLLAMELQKKEMDIESVLFEPMYIPHNQDALTVLQSFRREQYGMAVVLDEFGGVQGLLTVNDIVAAAFGAVPAILDHGRNRYKKTDENEWIVDGRLTIERFEELIELKLDVPDGFNTVAGFVIGFLERIPETGEKVEVQEIKFEILETVGNRLARLKVNK